MEDVGRIHSQGAMIKRIGERQSRTGLVVAGLRYSRRENGVKWVGEDRRAGSVGGTSRPASE